MSEWWTYSLSDFLLFSAHTYYRLFELYNLAVWPWQIVALALGVGVLALWLRGGSWRGRAIAAILAICWLWVAWAYLLVRYDTINWAASYFAIGFMIEAALLVWSGLIRDGVRLRRGRDAATMTGFGMFGVALFVWPLIGLLARAPDGAGGGVRRRTGSHRGGDDRRHPRRRADTLGTSDRSNPLVRDQRRDLVDHGVAECFLVAGGRADRDCRHRPQVAMGDVLQAGRTHLLRVSQIFIDPAGLLRLFRYAP